MKKKEIIFCLVIASLFFVAFIVFISIQKNSTKQRINQSFISEVYLYHSNKVGKVTTESKSYKELVDEVVYLINDSSACEDTIDGFFALEGKGKTMDKSMDKYLMQIEFTQPVEMKYLGRKQQNISTILIDVEEKCLYLYREENKSERYPYIAYRYKDSYLNKTLSIVLNYFKITT